MGGYSPGPIPRNGLVSEHDFSRAIEANQSVGLQPMRKVVFGLLVLLQPALVDALESLRDEAKGFSWANQRTVVAMRDSDNRLDDVLPECGKTPDYPGGGGRPVSSYNLVASRHGDTKTRLPY